MAASRGGLQAPGDVHPVEIGQRDVHQDEVGVLTAEHRERLGARVRDDGAKPLVGQQAFEELALEGVVVHHEDQRRRPAGKFAKLAGRVDLRLDVRSHTSSGCSTVLSATSSAGSRRLPPRL